MDQGQQPACGYRGFVSFLSYQTDLLNMEVSARHINKSTGQTTGERYLAKLAERSFLNLWCYPNPYRDQGRAGGRDGKELCDLLVVCGQQIIIFSEKNISWPGGDIDLAWRRWAKRALIKSARQARGAERWIKKHPDRIFLDRQCVYDFPIELPGEGATIHCVVVARGAGHACKTYFGDDTGSLRMRADISGEQHCSEDALPFVVGDIDPKGSFIHVMDDVTLDIVLGELDTVLDFTNYLTKKEKFIRSGLFRTASGEQGLLAHYAIRMNEDGEHDFEGRRDRSPLDIPSGEYQRFVQDPQYLARREANRSSYIWDRLIETFTSHMIEGTTQVLDGYEYELSRNEAGFRYMALERRVERRGLGACFAAAREHGADKPMFFRWMITPGAETGFFVLTMKLTGAISSVGGYDDYRQMRATLAIIYAKGVLLKHPHLARVVGISCEPAGQIKVSEDLVYVEQADWSDADRAAILEDCQYLGFLQSGAKEHHWRVEEFPVPPA